MTEHAKPPHRSLSQRVRETLEDLAEIHRSLTETEPGDGGQQPNAVLDLELAAELQSVVDALRKLLWAYITALSSKSGRQPQEVLEWYKMELAVEMLHSRRSGPSAPSASPTENPCTFEDLITNALAVTAQHTGSQ